MKVARAKGRPRGKQPSSRRQEAHLVALHAAGKHTISELEELFSISGRRCTGTGPRPSPRDDLIGTLPLGSASGVPGRQGQAPPANNPSCRPQRPRHPTPLR